MAITAAPAQEDPGTVTDLSVASVSDSTVTLTWTEVDDGTGNPAKYALRYGTPTISWGDAYPTEVSVEGSSIGSPIQYTWEGLEPGTDYEFQLVSYRGTLNVDATFGGWSDVVGATTGDTTTEETLERVSGDGQSGTVGTALTNPLRVRVVDGTGSGVSGHAVSWSVTSGGGSVSPTSGTTDADGYAETTWTLGTSTAGNGVSAAVDALGSVSFEATALAGPVSTVTVQPSSATVTVSSTKQFTAKAEDQYGNTVSGLTCTWTSSDGAVASVSSDGVATGLAAGSTQISAEIDEVSGIGTLFVDEESSGDGTPMFSDDFDIGSLAPANDDFSWHSPGTRHQVSDLLSRSGTYSLQFFFPGVSLGKDVSAEHSFDHKKLREYWVEYHIYYPDGTESDGSGGTLNRYEHRSDGASNNKFWTYWGGERDTRTEYSNPPAGNASTWPDGNGDSRIGFVNKGGYWGNVGQFDFLVQGDTDRGRWIQVRIYIRLPDIDASNGQFRMWKDGTIVAERLNQPAYNAEITKNHLSNGYLLGWANSGFTEDTHIFVDDFKFYDEDPGWGK
jgi:hypothetical protein